MKPLERPSPDMRARLLAAARRTPAAPPGAWRRRVAGVGAFTLAWTLLAAVAVRPRPDWGELPVDALVQTFVVLAAIAGLAAVAGLSRGRSMTGLGVERAATMIGVGAMAVLALVVAVDPRGPSTKLFTGAAMGAHVIPCDLMIVGLGLPLLGAGLLPVARLTLSRPGLVGSAVGLAAATVSHLVIRFHCSIGGAGHAILGHVLPAIPLMAAGAWASRARMLERLGERFHRFRQELEEKQ